MTYTKNYEERLDGVYIRYLFHVDPLVQKCYVLEGHFRHELKLDKKNSRGANFEHLLH